MMGGRYDDVKEIISRSDWLAWLRRCTECKHYVSGIEGGFYAAYCKAMDLKYCTFKQCPLRNKNARNSEGNCESMW